MKCDIEECEYLQLAEEEKFKLQCMAEDAETDYINFRLQIKDSLKEIINLNRNTEEMKIKIYKLYDSI